MGKDYYSTLEITRSASDMDIKKSYRRLALKFHPHNDSEPGAYDKFRQLAEAYDVLSDPRKKATYDKFGEEGLKGGIPPKSAESGAWSSQYVFHENPEKTFRQFFGVDNPFADFHTADGKEVEFGFGGLRGRGMKKQDPPIERDLHLSLEELFHGCTKKMKIFRRVMNEDGHTTEIKDKILTITVRPGWNEGTRITFPQESDQGPNCIPADIVFIVQIKPHPRFSRKNNDLIYTENISLEKALNGFSVDVETLDDRLINIPVNDIVTPEYSKVVPGEGMPLPGNPSVKGDLIIKFETHFPDSISPERKQLIKQALTM